MITIVDYGVGNLASIQNILKKVGAASKISTSVIDIEQAEKLILPGVGHFDNCATKLQQSNVINALSQKVLENKAPILGICVGMQLLLSGSEEGNNQGLNWIEGKNVKFDETKVGNLKIPHMGWADVHLQKHSKLFANMYDEPRFYFVHSYHAQINNTEDVLLTAEHGYSFACAVERNNIMGVQFHPEKSHKFGMQLFENFVKNY